MDGRVTYRGAKAAEIYITNRCSLGPMEPEVNQSCSFRFNGHEDNAVVFAKLKELATLWRRSIFGPEAERGFV